VTNTSGERLYLDSDGIKRNLRGMIRHEPDWVAGRFEVMEDGLASARETIAEREAEIAELRKEKATDFNKGQNHALRIVGEHLGISVCTHNQVAKAVAELRAVVEDCKWPMTVDNVRVLPGMDIWYAGKDTDWEPVATRVEWVAVAGSRDRSTLPCAFGDGDELNLDVFYSTREAAESARTGRKE